MACSCKRGRACRSATPQFGCEDLTAGCTSGMASAPAPQTHSECRPLMPATALALHQCVKPFASSHVNSGPIVSGRRLQAHGVRSQPHTKPGASACCLHLGADVCAPLLLSSAHELRMLCMRSRLAPPTTRDAAHRGLDGPALAEDAPRVAAHALPCPRTPCHCCHVVRVAFRLSRQPPASYNERPLPTLASCAPSPRTAARESTTSWAPLRSPGCGERCACLACRLAYSLVAFVAFVGTA